MEVTKHHTILSMMRVGSRLLMSKMVIGNRFHYPWHSYYCNTSLTSAPFFLAGRAQRGHHTGQLLQVLALLRCGPIAWAATHRMSRAYRGLPARGGARHVTPKYPPHRTSHQLVGGTDPTIGHHICFWGVKIPPPESRVSPPPEWGRGWRTTP